MCRCLFVSCLNVRPLEVGKPDGASGEAYQKHIRPPGVTWVKSSGQPEFGLQTHR